MIIRLGCIPTAQSAVEAHLGEVIQLRKEDIQKVEGHWIFKITPEAGTQKTKQFRDIPIHSHIIEQGFLKFVNSAPKGHLFMWTGNDRAAWRTAKNRLTQTLSPITSNLDIQPNHAWRYTFKTFGLESGIAPLILDMLTGHAPNTVGEDYFGKTIKTKADAMAKFPHFEVSTSRKPDI